MRTSTKSTRSSLAGTSILRRATLGAALIGTLASIGGVLTLVVVAGTVGANSLASLACWLVSAAALRTERRWAFFTSAVCGGVILVLLAEQPYVTTSLANPAGPNGGIAHFAADLLILACAALVFVGSAVTGIIFQSEV